MRRDNQKRLVITNHILSLHIINCYVNLQVANWMRNLKNSRRKHSIDDTMTCGAQKGAFIRKTTIEDLSSRRVPNDNNEMEIIKLRDQVEELERRLATREGMLEICYQHAKQNSDGNSEVIRLSSHIEELQRQLAEKDMQWASARELLQHKEVKFTLRMIHRSQDILGS